MNKFLLLLTLLSIKIILFAQVPAKMSYQAVIRNTNNQLISNQIIGIRISILQESASGEPIYTEIQNPQTNANGLISIQIGGGSGFDLIDWSNGPYFLKTETDPGGGTNYTISGTSQILSVPFALYADKSGNGLSTGEIEKLAGISTGAEVNVNADWNATDGDAVILNKPIVNGSETKLSPGINIIISGNGTEASPYIIHSNANDTVSTGRVKGEMKYWNGTSWVLIPPGHMGQVLTINSGGIPCWQDLTTASQTATKMKYIKDSYDLSNYNDWIHLNQVFKTAGVNPSYNIFVTTELCQLDYDSDGLEDIFCADPDSILNTFHPQILYKNMGNGTYFKQSSEIPNTTGCKVIVGDFNNDTRPDIFSLSAVDLPGGGPAILPNNVLLNDGQGSFIKKEIPFLGFWYAGASGDIDNDGDIDIVIFNFHTGMTGEKSRILWNDGLGNFTSDLNGIGDLYDPPVDNAELYDLNYDGFIDLIVNRPVMPNGYGINTTEILWGNGSGFSENNRTVLPNLNPNPMMDIDFVDHDGDNIKEIILAYNPNGSIWEINMFKTNDNGRSYIEVTNIYIPEHHRLITDDIFRFLRVQDIDNNGWTDIFSSGKRENIRWEQNYEGKFIRKY